MPGEQTSHRQDGRIWRDICTAALSFRNDPVSVRTARRAASTLAVPLLALVAVGHAELTLYPTFGAFASVYGRQPSPPARLRTRTLVSIWLSVCVTAGAAVGVSPQREWLVLPVAACAAAAGTTLAARGRWFPPGALFAVFAVAACASIPTPATRVPIAAALAAGTAALSMVPDLLIVIRRTAVAPGNAPAETGAASGDVWPAVIRAAAQTAVAVLLAGLLANVAGIGHPYWAMVAAVAASTGATAAARIARGVQRIVGTVLGIVVAAAVLGLQPTVWVTVLLAIALQGLGEYCVGRNYAIALVFITPLALLMAELARRQSASALLRERIVETALGAACGMIVTVAAAVPRHAGKGRDRTRR